MLIELLFPVIALRHYSHHALYLSLWHYTRDEFKCSKVISLSIIYSMLHVAIIHLHSRKSLHYFSERHRDIRLDEVAKWWIFVFIKWHDDAADLLGDEVLTSHLVWCSGFVICVRAYSCCIVRASWDDCSSLTDHARRIQSAPDARKC